MLYLGSFLSPTFNFSSYHRIILLPKVGVIRIFATTREVLVHSFLYLNILYFIKSEYFRDVCQNIRQNRKLDRALEVG